MLLNAIEVFSDWSGMEVKIVKSCDMWVGLWKQDEGLPLKLIFRIAPLRIVTKDAPVRYLGKVQATRMQKD